MKTTSPDISELELSTLRPIDTFLYYDGPLVFTAEFKGKLYLSYSWWSLEDRENRTSTFAHFLTSPEAIKELKADKISIRDFFKASEKIYISVYSYLEKKQISIHQVNFLDIEEDSPKPGVMMEADDAGNCV